MKVWKPLVATFLAAAIMAGCGKADAGTVPDADGNVKIDELSIAFVPSRDPEEIKVATEPLAGIVKERLMEKGFDVDKVDVSVGTNYEAVGQAMISGTTDVGFLPGGTYVLYDDGADVILTSTRAGLSNDSDKAADWNANSPTTNTDEQVTYYRSLILAGPSEKGRELAAKVNAGEELTWEDLDSARWAVMSTSSSAGYIYPTLWLRDRFDGKGVSDLSQVVQSESYTSSFARLAAEQVDVMVVFADGRIDNADAWNGELGREGSIWDEVQVIGVTQGIFNDTISVSKNSEKMTPEFRKALQEVFIELAQTQEGLDIISIYSHQGYKEAQSSDYDGEREAQKVLREQNS